MIKSFLRLQSDWGSKKHLPFSLDSILSGDPKHPNDTHREHNFFLFCSWFPLFKHRGYLDFPLRKSFILPWTASEVYRHNNDRLEQPSRILGRQEELHKEIGGGREKKAQSLVSRFLCENLSRMMSALLLCLKSVNFPSLGKCSVEDRHREKKKTKNWYEDVKK